MLLLDVINLRDTIENDLREYEKISYKCKEMLMKEENEEYKNTLLKIKYSTQTLKNILIELNRVIQNEKMQ